ncbi:hypothetical protein [Burkholderia plantarii]|nr:hypothetical protein [Burkholderia plantarii]
MPDRSASFCRPAFYSLDHFALNASPQPRTIFCLEFERAKQMVPAAG